MAEDVKIYVSETVERVEIKVSDPFPTRMLPTGTLEINDIKANTLSSAETGGSIPTEIYSWFKDKFALLVDKLLSSWVHGLIFITKAIDEALTSLQSTVSEHATSLEVIAGRLDAIDDKLIVNYVVPVDTAAVIIDKDKHGNPLNLTGEVEICRLSIFGCNNALSNGNTIYINDINEDIYRQTYLPAIYGINSRGGYAYSNTRHNIIIANSSIFWISEIECANDINTSPTQYRYLGHSISSLRQINSITKLEFKDGDGTKLIKAGTIITIRRK
jgi:hypothetical protein